MSIAYVGLGSNMGNKVENIQKALHLLDSYDAISVLKFSSFYETEPVGYEEQDWFVNAVVKLETNLSPKELLNAFMEIEQIMGRKRHIKWGPRIIDIDLLLYDQIVIDSPDLIIPHPRMHERAFVLVPLANIDPDINHPIFNKTVDELLKNMLSKKIIKLID